MITVLVYLVFRLPFLLKLPIFNDEAIYLDWGWRMINLPNHTWYSLQDAKQPLLLWVYGLIQGLFSNPLLAGRLASIFFGGLTAWGVYKLSNKNKLAPILYSVIPLFAFYDRQALMESSLMAVGVWSFYFLKRSLESKKIIYPILPGLILGLGFWVKSTGLVFCGLSILVILSFLKKHPIKGMVPFLKKIGLVFAAGLIILLPLLFQPLFWEKISTTSRWSLTFLEVINLPLNTWIKNVFGTIDILFWQLTPPVLGLIAWGVIKSNRKYSKIWFLTGIFVVALTSREIQPRYLVPFLPLGIVFATEALEKINKKVLTGLSLATAGVFGLILILNPTTYFNSLQKVSNQSQKNTYVTNWTSGFGVYQSIQYVKLMTQSQPALVGVRLDAGNPESAVWAYLHHQPNLKPVYLDQRLFKIDLKNFDCLDFSYPIYFVSRDNHLAGLDHLLENEKRFYKPEQKNYVSVWQVETQGQNCLDL